MADQAVARITAIAFLKAHTAGVLATVSGEGHPHASAIFYTTDERFSIYFLTLRSSRKYAAIQANPWAAFVVGEETVPQTLQIEGPISELRSDEEKQRRIPDLVKILTSNSTYYAPITKLDPVESAVMWLDAKWVRWGDYASPLQGTEDVLTEIKL